MIINFLLLSVGLLLIVFGANFMTDGAAIIARKFRVSEFVIGLTIIAIGTSSPEIVVSLSSAFKGSTEMALGNIVGSNIFNTFVIIGIVALMRPIRLSKENCFKTIPATLFASLILLLFCLNVFGVNFMPDKITRLQGVILLSAFVFFMIKSLNTSKGKTIESFNAPIEKKTKVSPIVKGGIMAIGGLSVLLFGGSLFLDYAVKIAKNLGVSNYIISVTLLGGGTSIPELVSSVIAARKGMPQMALGNVLGSNIANILLVLGSTAIIKPLSLADSSMLDISLVSVGAFLLLGSIFAFRRHQIDRVEGAILIVVYIGYLTYLLYF